VIRIATALASKPKGAINSTAPKRDPFDPPEEELFVKHISDTHSLVLYVHCAMI